MSNYNFKLPAEGTASPESASETNRKALKRKLTVFEMVSLLERERERPSLLKEYQADIWHTELSSSEAHWGSLFR